MALLTPMETLDAMILAGWGDVRRDRIPKDWQKKKGPGVNGWREGVTFGPKPKLKEGPRGPQRRVKERTQVEDWVLKLIDQARIDEARRRLPDRS